MSPDYIYLLNVNQTHYIYMHLFKNAKPVDR